MLDRSPCGTLLTYVLTYLRTYLLTYLLTRWTAMLDRSPCGTGTCAVMAAMHARGELAIGKYVSKYVST